MMSSTTKILHVNNSSDMTISAYVTLQDTLDIPKEGFDNSIQFNNGEVGNIRIIIDRKLDGIVFVIDNKTFIELPASKAKMFLASSLSAVTELSNG